MKSVISITVSLTAVAFIAPSATIINIPDDYPTIQQGIDASTDGDTVLVHPGTYVENINFNGHNIVLGSLFLTTGDTAYIEQTIIDGDLAGSVVTFANGEDNTTIIQGFTIQRGLALNGGGISSTNSSPIISNNMIRNNASYYTIMGTGQGGGVYCLDYSGVIFENSINNNVSEWGGGIYCANSQCSIFGNIVHDNIASGHDEWDSAGGGGLLLWECNALVVGNSFFHNAAYAGLEPAYGGAAAFFYSTTTTVNNTVFQNTDFDYYYDAPEEIFLQGGDMTMTNTIIWHPDSTISVRGGNFIIEYCDIIDGIDGLGNIRVDPLFRDPESGDFHLMTTACGDPYDSPCIDAGHPDILDSLLDCSWGLGELRSDMGAYGGGDSVTVGIDDYDIPIPQVFSLSQNYPNPFNAATVIRYALPELAHVKIEIYDILGRRTETLIDMKQQAGYHQITWNADERSSGIYVYRIEAGNNAETRKMLLLR